MSRLCQFPARTGAALGTICALFILMLGAQASDRHGEFTEEFHHTYTISPNGHVELDNINGAVHISSWDRGEVKVDAVKYAGSKDRLEEARIEVDAGNDYVSIRTKYPRHNL